MHIKLVRRVVQVSSRISSLIVTVPLALWTALVTETFHPSVHDMRALICSLFALLVYALKMVTTDGNWMYETSAEGFILISVMFMGLSVMERKTFCGETEGIFFQESENKNDAITSMQRKFLAICFSAMIAFVLVYVLAANGVIGPDLTLVFNIVADSSFRLAFTITALEVHVTLFQNVEAELLSEQKSHSRRKAFMKYIFHEM